MKRGLQCVPLCAIFFLVGCPGPSAPTEHGGGAVLTEAHPEAMRARGWLEFSDLSLRVEADGNKPVGPHVKGWVVGGLFLPSGDVEGRVTERPRGRILTAGFLELLKGNLKVAGFSLLIAVLAYGLWRGAVWLFPDVDWLQPR